MRHGNGGMVSSITTTADVGGPRGVDRARVAELLRAGHQVDEVAWMLGLTRREVRRAARRAGVA